MLRTLLVAKDMVLNKINIIPALMELILFRGGEGGLMIKLRKVTTKYGQMLAKIKGASISTLNISYPKQNCKEVPCMIIRYIIMYFIKIH